MKSSTPPAVMPEDSMTASRKGVVFVAGSCNPNPGPNATAAAVLLFPKNRRIEQVRSLGYGTNNAAELAAAILGLQLALAENLANLEFYSCSTVVLDCLRGKRETRGSSPLNPLRLEAR